MRQTYATARFLAIAACGEFTEPARDYVLSRSVELLFVPKQNIVSAFAASGLTIDYDDSLTESKKKALVAQLEKKFVGKLEDSIKENLLKHIGTTTLSSFKSTVRGALTASPQEIKITALKLSKPSVFLSVEEATNFLSAPSFNYSDSGENYRYDVLYSDGTQFSRSLNSIQEVRNVHASLCRLVNHMNRISG
jgi:hypothetical protein